MVAIHRTRSPTRWVGSCHNSGQDEDPCSDRKLPKYIINGAEENIVILYATFWLEISLFTIAHVPYSISHPYSRLHHVPDPWICDPWRIDTAVEFARDVLIRSVTCGRDAVTYGRGESSRCERLPHLSRLRSCDRVAAQNTVSPDIADMVDYSFTATYSLCGIMRKPDSGILPDLNLACDIWKNKFFGTIPPKRSVLKLFWELSFTALCTRTCRSRSSVGRALDSVWWQHTSRFQKSGVRGATGARCLSSLLAGMVAVGGRP